MISSRPDADFSFKEFRALVLAELEQAVQKDPTLLEDRGLDIQRAASARTEVPISLLPPHTTNRKSVSLKFLVSASAQERWLVLVENSAAVVSGRWVIISL